MWDVQSSLLAMQVSVLTKNTKETLKQCNTIEKEKKNMEIHKHEPSMCMQRKIEKVKVKLSHGGL
jgi:hypothetical protein